MRMSGWSFAVTSACRWSLISETSSEIAWLERLEPGCDLGDLQRLVGLYLRRADGIVAIGETMRTPRGRVLRPSGISVIPNWLTRPVDRAAAAGEQWARRRAPAAFRIMRSGDVGHARSLDALVRSATFLRRRGLRADPSSRAALYGILAAGRPVIVRAPTRTARQRRSCRGASAAASSIAAGAARSARGRRSGDAARRRVRSRRDGARGAGVRGGGGEVADGRRSVATGRARR